MNESANPILKYFSEFKILKTVSKDFWLTNAVSYTHLTLPTNREV